MIKVFIVLFLFLFKIVLFLHIIVFNVSFYTYNVMKWISSCFILYVYLQLLYGIICFDHFKYPN